MFPPLQRGTEGDLDLPSLNGIGRVFCWVSIHQVHNWQWRESGLCIQDGECQRCGRKRQRTRHEWPAGLRISEGLGFKTLTCTRCGEEPPREPPIGLRDLMIGLLVLTLVYIFFR